MLKLVTLAGALVAMPLSQATACDIVGTVSYYGRESCVRPSHCLTASGAPFTGREMTAAMPAAGHLGERWRVTWAGHHVDVLVNDRGPAAYLHRVMDLSEAAAEAVGVKQPGRRGGLALGACLTRLS